MILMLEDDSDRLQRFNTVLDRFNPAPQLKTWRNAHIMIREAGPFLNSASLICLDHDLDPELGECDPGDGYVVTKWLVSQSIARPVLVHSSNAERALWMVGEFELAEWQFWRVAPIGDDWIEVDWYDSVRRILSRKRRVDRPV